MPSLRKSVRGVTREETDGGIIMAYLINLTVDHELIQSRPGEFFVNLS
jgi:hypothetical protein